VNPPPETPFAHARPDGALLRGRFLAGNGALTVFLPGFRSVCTGEKAEAVAAWARKNGHACLRLDYLGHGESDGPFERFRVSEAIEDVAAALARVRRPGQALLLAGSSMGAWIAVTAAARGRIEPAGMVLIAPAIDFVSRRLAEMDPDLRARLAATGSVEVADAWPPFSRYRVTSDFLDDALALEPGDAPLPVPCPVRILHGTEDESVPVETARRLARLLPDAKLTEIPGGDHRLNTHIGEILGALEEIEAGRTG
jgi:pimeloyl-ACP methyl ester carboxylesterase